MSTQSQRRSLLLVFLIWCVAYLPRLAIPPLFAPDELRYAQIPQEILRTRDWIVPHFIGVAYFEKPVLGYWLTASSMQIFGENALALRLPSAFAALLTSFLIFLLIRKVDGSYLRAQWGAIVCLLCGLFAGVGGLNVLDMPFSFFVSLSLGAYFLSFYSRQQNELFTAESSGIFSRGWMWAILSGVAAGLALMTKGFLALVLPIAVLGPFLLWERRVLAELKWCVLAFTIAILVVLPWGVMVHQADPGFWRFFIEEGHLRRFMAENAQHPESPFYFVPLILGGLLPWLPLLPATIAGLRRLQTDSLTRFAICWFVFTFLFFSVSKGKLPTYIIPCFPPLAILIARGSANYFSLIESTTSRLVSVPLKAWSLILLSLGIGVVIFTVSSHKGFSISEELWKLVIACGVLAICGVTAWRASGIASIRSRMALLTIGPILFYLALPICLPHTFLDTRAPAEDVLEIKSLITPDTTIIADFRMATAASWYFDRRDIFIAFEGHELTYGLSRPDQRYRWLPEAKDIQEKISAIEKEGRSVAFICRANRWQKMKGEMPSPKSLKVMPHAVLAMY